MGDGLIGGDGRPDPKRAYSVQETLSFFPRHRRLPEVEQRRHPPYRQDLYDTMGEIAGCESAGMVAAQDANDPVITPFEV